MQKDSIWFMQNQRIALMFPATEVYYPSPSHTASSGSIFSY